MKNVTLKCMLFSVALVSSAAMLAQREGTLQFQNDNEEFSRKNTLEYMAHRGGPLVGDFNGDGMIDFYLTGTTCFYGWGAKGVPFENLGEANFKAHGGYRWDVQNPIVEYEYEYETEIRYQTNENGDFVLDGDGNKIPERDDDGNIIYDNVKDENGNDVVKKDEEGNPIIKKDENGNPIIRSYNYARLDVEGEGVEANPAAAYTDGSMPIDFNQDGLLDYIVVNSGGQNTGTKGEIFILKNLGNFKFEKVTCEAFDVISDGGEWERNSSNSFNEKNYSGILSVGDYDRDGYPDFIVQSTHYNSEKRKGNVTLFHNVNGEYFEVADVFDPMPIEHEYCINRLYKKGEDMIDPDEPSGDVMIPGMYDINQPTYQPASLRSSNLVMADFNGDGWLDIVISGWYDGDGNVNPSDPYRDLANGGWGIRFYQNTKDGRFKDVTYKMIDLAGEALLNNGMEADITGTIKDVLKAYGAQNAVLVPLDWNEDGVMDLFMNQDSRGKHLSVVLQGIPGEDLAFTEVETGLPSVYWSAERSKLFADFNGDDKMDFIMFGGADYYREDDTFKNGGWTAMFASSNADGGYTIVDTDDGERPADLKYEMGFGREDGEVMVFGDFNNDGLLDQMQQKWSNGYVADENYKNQDGSIRESCERVSVSFNITPGAAENLMAPEVPEGLEAVEVEDGDGEVLVTWDANSILATGAPALYNLYIKNKETGKTFMLVPAVMESGKQMCYLPNSNYVLAGIDGEPSYSFMKMPKGEYEIGVQAVSPNYMASEFATCDVTVNVGHTSAVKSVKSDALNVIVDGDVVTVKSAEEGHVAVYAISGAQVAEGTTNKGITVNGKGVFMVKVNGQSVKFVK